MKKIILNLIFFSIVLSDNNNILVKVKDRVITKNDFIKRAEYTIRPAYCNSDNTIHKKIILNSLIAEKLMAIEIEPFMTDENLANDFLIGIKEQKMREVMLDEKVYQSIIIEDEVVQKHVLYSTKTYDLNFLSLYNDSLSVNVLNQIQNGKSFSEICFDYLKLEEIPKKKVGYFDEIEPPIHDALFSKDLDKNEIIDPIYLNNDSVLLLQVEGWTNSPLITKEDREAQIDKVKEALYMKEYNKAFKKYVAQLMKGLNLSFFEEPFYKLADKHYANLTIKDNNDSMDEKNIVLNPSEPFLTFNSKVYTVEDINKLISKHPLTYRKDNIPEPEFYLQFKFALVDLIRDEKLNEESYVNEYDKHLDVVKEYEMFKDASLSILHLKAFLKDRNFNIDEFNETYLSVMDSDLNSYIDSLKQKYSNEILINTDLLDSIKLTRIDLYAYKKGVPYPFVVPSFPILTNKHTIDFGQKTNF